MLEEYGKLCNTFNEVISEAGSFTTLKALFNIRYYLYVHQPCTLSYRRLKINFLQAKKIAGP